MNERYGMNKEDCVQIATGCKGDTAYCIQCMYNFRYLV